MNIESTYPNIIKLYKYSTSRVEYEIGHRSYTINIAAIMRNLRIKKYTHLTDRLIGLGHTVSTSQVTRLAKGEAVAVNMDVIVALIHLCAIESLDVNDFIIIDSTALSKVIAREARMPISPPRRIRRDEAMVDSDGEEILDEEDDWFASPDWIASHQESHT